MAPPSRRKAPFQLGPWLVEPALDRLNQGEGAVHLRPRLTDLLVYLAERPGEVISKDELLQQRYDKYRAFGEFLEGQSLPTPPEPEPEKEAS